MLIVECMNYQYLNEKMSRAFQQSPLSPTFHFSLSLCYDLRYFSSHGWWYFSFSFHIQLIVLYIPRWQSKNYNDDIVFIQYLHTVLTTNDDNNTTTIIVVNIDQMPYGEYNNNAGNCGHHDWSRYPHSISIHVLWYNYTYYIYI